MSKALIIIPTKDRREALCSLLASLQYQDGEYDIFIGDMSTEKNYLTDYWNFRILLEFLKMNKGHQYYVQRVEGKNQMDACQAGLEYASKNGYEICFDSDDDILYDAGFIAQGFKIMDMKKDIGVLVGHTLLPWEPLSKQTITDEQLSNPDFNGMFKNLENGGYYHCSMVHPYDKNMREYQQLFGSFFFRTKDVLDVGGFPLYLSKLGYRGEMIVHSALLFAGKKLVLNPKMLSWHYSVPYGGLRMVQGEEREQGRKHDEALCDAVIKRGTPSTSKPEV